MLITSLFTSLFGVSKEVRILVLGLDNAGKTTILYRLHSPEAVVHTVPTIGFNVETISFKNIKLQVWDLGGQTNIRPYWRCYFPGTNAIIFVVDSTDTDRLDIAKKELSSLLEEEELATVALLVFANKQDAAGALSAAAISEALGLQSIKTHSWFICRAVATTGEGLHEGLDWLVNQINSSK